MPPQIKYLRLYFVALIICLGAPLFANDIAKGPMLGPVGMREARVWVQTTEPATVRLAYRQTGDARWSHFSAPVTTSAVDALTAELVAARVTPATNYEYAIEVNGRVLEPMQGQAFTTQDFFRERRPAPDFTVAICGSHYVIDGELDLPYRDLGGDYGIFGQIEKANPDWVLWAGASNILREADASTLSGMLRRYEQTRDLADSKKLLRSRPHYANWSRRDFGPLQATAHAIGHSAAHHVFSRFWITPGRERELAATTIHPGRYTTFTWADVRFIFLDVNSFRIEAVSENMAPVLLGQQQLDWLRSILASSTEPFKVIVAGVALLNPARNPGNYSTYRSEHERFVRILRDHGGSGLFFINGGNDYGEFTRFVQSGHYDFHELTIGPLTATPRPAADGLNFFRQPGTYHEKKQFGLLRFSGPENARVLSLEIHAVDGSTLWTRELSYDRLQN